MFASNRRRQSGHRIRGQAVRQEDQEIIRRHDPVRVQRHPVRLETYALLPAVVHPGVFALPVAVRQAGVPLVEGHPVDRVEVGAAVRNSFLLYLTDRPTR